ncbi:MULTISPECIES: EAL domain-containing protein [unclassified Marinomonas]|uniref:EAL domain-containing protein n=1 Tax=unclassified Marinomonas TaxID=196814 RepID=UPI000B14C759|nr:MULTISPECIES: EAL domain-containing protein [unclassified Marinomonas]
MHLISRYFKYFTVCLILLLSFSTHANTRAKNILIILSYSTDFPSYPSITKAFSQSLSQHNLSYEYLNSKNNWSHDYQALMGDFLSKKQALSNEKIDLIISVDDNALDFVRKNHTSLYQDIPVVFMGVNDVSKLNWAKDQTFFTGFYEAPSFKENLLYAQGLFPDSNTIHLINDASTSSRANTKQLIKAASSLNLDKHLNLISLEDLNWKQFEQSLALLPENEPIVLVSVFVDKNGERKSYFQGLNSIIDNSDSPIITFWSHGLGKGILGGHMINPAKHAQAAADYAKVILEGNSLSLLPIIYNSPNSNEFDLKQLDKHQIELSQLPADTSFINPTKSLLNNLWVIILLISIIVICLIVAVTYLTLQVRRRTQAEADLLQEKALLAGIINTIPDHIVYKDKDYRYQVSNSAFENFVQLSKSKLIGHTDHDLFENKIISLFHPMDSKVVQTGKELRCTEYIALEQGDSAILDIIKTPFYNNKGVLTGIISIARDISQSYKQQEENRLLATFFKQSSEGMVIVSKRGRILTVNPALISMTGFSAEQLIGSSFRKVLANSSYKAYRNMSIDLKNVGKWQGEMEYITLTQQSQPGWVIATSVLDEMGQISHFVASFSDISKLKRSQSKLQHLAHHDSLTGLPNRTFLTQKLSGMISQARKNEKQLAVAFLDLDRFKNINDTLGHMFGDKLLRVIARRMYNQLEENEVVARIGGDEFILILDPSDGLEALGTRLDLLNQKIQEMVYLDGKEIMTCASIGVSLYPQDGTSSELLFQHADTALYSAKEAGRAMHKFYASALTIQAQERLTIESHLAKALEYKEMTLAYQPIYDFRQQKFVKVEALLRWQTPKLGQVSPDKFIPIAEETGGILNIGNWVLETACRTMVQWQQRSCQIQRIAVNVSRIQIARQNMFETVKEILQQTKCKPQWIEIEVTESAIMNLSKDGLKQLTQLKEFGVSISIDDFGTGQSSLSSLKTLPVSTLKIDKSFVQDMPENNNDVEIARLILQMSKVLNVRSVAEGVETAEQAQVLKNMGCDLCQGYLFSKPLTEEALAAFINHPSWLQEKAIQAVSENLDYSY